MTTYEQLSPALRADFDDLAGMVEQETGVATKGAEIVEAIQAALAEVLTLSEQKVSLGQQVEAKALDVSRKMLVEIRAMKAAKPAA